MPAKFSQYIILLTFAAAFVAIFSGIGHDINIYDEAVPLVGAERILAGETPYDDFWTAYAPGQFYLMAGVMEVFGRHLITGRVITSIFMFLSVVIIYILARKIFESGEAAAPLLISALWIAGNPLYSSALATSIVIVLAGVYFLFRYFETSDRKYTLIAGLLIGLAGVFRHDVGAYIFGTEFWAVFFFGLPKKSADGLPFGKRVVRGIKGAAAFVVGFALVLLPAIIAVWISVPGGELYDQFIDFPLNIYGEYRGIPFPMPFDDVSSAGAAIKSIYKSFVFFAPLMIFIVEIIYLIWRVKKKRIVLNGHIFWKEVLLINVGLNFYNHAMVRSDPVHVMPAMLIASIFVVNAARTLPRPALKRAALAAICIVLIARPLHSIVKSFRSHSASQSEELTIEKASGIRVNAEYALSAERAADYIKSHTGEGERIFVVPHRTDKIYINDIMFYFFADRLPAAKHHELHPGVATEENTQREIIASLEDNKTEYIIRYRAGFAEEANKSSESSGVTLLDDFIDRNYEVTEKFRNYNILRLK
jgi:hypothetical protein